VTKILFRTLGTAHGIFGLGTLYLVIYLASQGKIAALSPGSFKTVGTAGAALTIVGLTACAVAAWKRPSIAVLFAWFAVLAFIITPVVQSVLQSGTGALDGLHPNFYYSTAIRVLAALVLTLLWLLSQTAANYSLKRTAAE
jgi:hypothetical protein